MLESLVKEASRSDYFYNVDFLFKSFSSSSHCLLFSFLGTTNNFAWQTLGNAKVLHALSLGGCKGDCLGFKQLGDQMIVEIVVVQNANYYRNSCD